MSESFLPTINGVTTSVRKVLAHLRSRGHEAILIVPAAGGPSSYEGFAVHEVPALAYREFPVGLPNPLVERLIGQFAPDVVHVASPFLLGAQALTAARRLGVPSVAIYQTDVAGYARRNRLGAATGFARRIVKWIHEPADLTLAPSSSALADLSRSGIDRTARWGRGVDLAAYHPSHRLRDSAVALRSELATAGEFVVGYVGRLAPEKQVERLRALRGVANLRVVIVGDGPSRASVERALSGMHATFLGPRSGEALADAYASFDCFVHTGTEETFGQTIQEAGASGLAVVAPRAGGPIDLVEHGTTGFLYTPGDDAELRSRVETLATDHALRARMGEAGRRAVLGRSWESVCIELEQHYERVIARAAVLASR